METRARRWREQKKRGVSPIIATILLVAITVVLAAVLYVLISGLTKGPGNTPIGSALAVSSATETSGSTPTAWYNGTISIQSASSGVTANSLKFQLVNSGGSITAYSSVALIDVSGCAVAYYVGGAWQTTVPTTPAVHYIAICSTTLGLTTSSQISSGDQLVLTTTTNVDASGYSLNVVGTGSYSGSVSASIP